MLGSAMYMIYTWDFAVELTAKYKKEYIKWDMEFWTVYSEIVKLNIDRKQYQNLQIAYCGKEWGIHKNKTLVKMFIELGDTDVDEAFAIYKREIKM